MVHSDVDLLQKRVHQYQQPAISLGNVSAASAAPAASTPFAPSSFVATPVPHRGAHDPFVSSNTPRVTTAPLIASDSSELLHPNQYKVPSSLPMFRTGSNAIYEVETFTRQFEVHVNAHGILIDTAWYRLLPLCLSFEMQDWLGRTHPPTQKWKNVQASLHQHYGDPTRRRTAITLIYSSSQRPDESIIVFMQRYIRLMRKAQAKMNNSDMVDYLLEQLPTDLAIQLESGIQYGRIQRDVVELETYARIFPGVNTKQRSARNNTPRKAGSLPTRPSKYCQNHGKCLHTTAECRLKDKKHASASSASASTKPRIPYRPNRPSAIASSENAKCYRCKKIGHFATECPEKGSDSTARRVDLNQDQPRGTPVSAYEVPVKINGYSLCPKFIVRFE